MEWLQICFCPFPLLNTYAAIKPVLYIVVFLALIGSLVFWKMLSSTSPTGGPPGAGPGGKPPAQRVTGFVANAQNLPMSLESSGTLLAWNEVVLMPEIGGKITQLNIKEGSEVAQGQLLVKLFDEDLKAQAKKQDLQATIANRNLARLKDLLKINGVSQQEYDNAENSLNNIASDLNLIKANLKKTEIFAPFSGTIGLTNASPGAYVSPGNSITSLQQTNVLKIEFSIPERYSTQLQMGDPVQFTIEGRADTFSATVYAFEPKIDLNTRTLKVRARFENVGRRLLPGSFAKVQVRLREVKNAILIPTQSVILETRGKKAIVYRGGKAQFVSIETGTRNQDNVQILKGISAGDTVVTTGLMFVKPNAEIVITKVVNAR